LGMYRTLFGVHTALFVVVSGSFANMWCCCLHSAAMQPYGVLLWMHRALLKRYRALLRICSALAYIVRQCSPMICPFLDVPGSFGGI